MKKLTASVIIILLLFTMIPFSYAQTLSLTYDGKAHKYTGPTYKLAVNDELVSSDVPVIVMSGYSMVPVRTLFEKLGGKVTWNSKTLKMTVSYSNMTIELTANNYYAKINGKSVKLNVQPKKINERLMFPVSSLKSQLNFSVELLSNQGILSVYTFGTIKAVDFSQNDGKDVLTVSTDRFKSYNITRLTDPDRLVVDIYNTKAQEKEIKQSTNGSFIKSVRYCSLNSQTARVILDLNGQPNFDATKKNGDLLITIGNTAYKNMEYSNNSDRTGFILKGAKLTTGDDKLTNLYKGSYDSTGKKYTITFPSSQANIGTGTMDINDSMLNSVDITEDSGTQKTSITFNAKSKFLYEIVTRPEVSDTAITILKPAAKGEKLVIIDAGHGGKDPGAVYGGLNEKDVNLDISLRLSALLKSKNIKTYLIRGDDSYIGLYERTFIANDLNAKLFLSIHNNSLPEDTSVGGTMTLYRPSTGNNGSITGKQFAQLVQEKLLAGIKTKDRKLDERPLLVVLKYTKMPAALAEVGFLTNKTDRTNLESATFKQKTADALSKAVIEALKKTK
ncbi:MAG: N-acetylmuramoyl-L-alanine amidase [Bacillota bacterium]|nr:N-acetylmuramoyl-L-alanine amidase [Bacillota bacterium]